MTEYRLRDEHDGWTWEQRQARMLELLKVLPEKHARLQELCPECEPGSFRLGFDEYMMSDGLSMEVPQLDRELTKLARDAARSGHKADGEIGRLIQFGRDMNEAARLSQAAHMLWAEMIGPQ